MNSSKKREKWTRADKISFFAAVFAVIVAVGPHVANWVGSLEAPRASITSPSAGDHVPNNAFGVAGTAAHIPADHDLWLVIRSGIVGRWYPITRLRVTGGRWELSPGKICPQPGPHDLEVFLVPDNGEGQFLAYVGSNAQHEGQGIDSIPPTADLKAASQIVVPTHAKLNCKRGRI